MVVWEDMREGFADVLLAFEGIWEIEARLDLGLAVVGVRDAGEELRDELRGESMLSLLMLGSMDGLGAVERVTIFIPRLVLVLAGMKSVCCLFAAGTAIR